MIYGLLGITAFNRTMSMVFLSLFSHRCAESAQKFVPLHPI